MNLNFQIFDVVVVLSNCPDSVLSLADGRSWETHRTPNFSILLAPQFDRAMLAISDQRLIYFHQIKLPLLTQPLFPVACLLRHVRTRCVKYWGTWRWALRALELMNLTYSISKASISALAQWHWAKHRFVSRLTSLSAQATNEDALGGIYNSLDCETQDPFTRPIIAHMRWYIPFKLHFLLR
jgi:hypothetical protein